MQVWRQITYLRSLLDFTPNTPVLKRARRTIGLANLAVATQDVRLVREARVSYGRLLGMLQFTLMFPSKVQTASEVRELVASIALLSHISDSPALCQDSDDSWATHLLAAQQLYNVHAPKALAAMMKLDDGLMRHVIMNGFFLALAKRTAKSVDTTFAIGLKSKGWSALLPPFNRLPGLLEETDKALDARADVSVLLKILVQLQTMRDKNVGLYPELQNPPVISAAKVNEFDNDAEEHLVMADSTTFPELYAPLVNDGGTAAFKVVLSTILVLTIQCTILRILHFRPEILGAIPITAQRTTEESAYQLARRLCKVSLSFTHTNKIAIVAMLRLTVLFARNVFEQQDRLPEMGWCEACLIANHLRMQRVRSSAAPTLCKIEDITPGLVEAGRYKMIFDRKAFIIKAPQVPSMRLLQ